MFSFGSGRSFAGPVKTGLAFMTTFLRSVETDASIRRPGIPLTIPGTRASTVGLTAGRAACPETGLVTLEFDEPPAPGTDEVWAAYLRAKKAAEEAVRATDLEWTILRPGRLTDDPGTNSVLLEPPPVPRGDVTRDDTAAVIVALLDTPGTAGQVLELREGSADVLEAAAKVAR